MSELDLLLVDLEKLRRDLLELNHRNQEDYLDPEILIASQMFNAVLNKYNEIIQNAKTNPATLK